MEKKSKQSNHDTLSHTCAPMKEHLRCSWICALSSLFPVFLQATLAAPPLPFQDPYPVSEVPPKMLLLKSLLSVGYLCGNFDLLCVNTPECSRSNCSGGSQRTPLPWLYQHILHKDLRFVCNKAKVLLCSLLFLHRL